MRIALGADHAGVVLKDQIKERLAEHGRACTDLGVFSTVSVDYPDIAALVARAVADGTFDRGILVCGSGLGMALAANKVAGIRAVAVVDDISARLGRAHNDVNVLALGARLMDLPLALQLVTLFLDTRFEGGRHQRRLDKIAAMDGGPMQVSRGY